MENTTSLQQSIILLGRELHFASGTRAVAAAEVIRNDGSTTVEGLFEALEASLPSPWLFESYTGFERGPHLALGRSLPLPSIAAYVALHNHFGSDWLVQALTQYAQFFGPQEWRKTPEQFARKLIERAQYKHEKALSPRLPRALATFAQEFENFDGLRPLALVELFSSESPVDCTDTMSMVCLSTLGDDLASQGTADRDELADICDDIFTVREHFDQGDWIKKGLQAYFVQLKKLAPEVAEAESQRVIEAAEARHAEVIASRSPSAV